MKNLIPILVLLISTSCRVTSLDLVANKFSYREKTNDQWTEFTDWVPANVPVKMKKSPFKILKSQVIFYDATKLTLKIVSENQEDTTEKGERIISYNCIDNDKAKCYLILVDKGESVNAVVYYTNINLCYNLVESK